MRGQVTTISFASRMVGRDFAVVPTRYLLLQTNETQQNQSDGWGLGVELPLSLLQARGWRLAQTGDAIRVRGRLTRLAWDVAMVEKPTLTGSASTPSKQLRRRVPSAVWGSPCERDMDCQDELWCERRGVCGAIPALNWDSDQANINGTCLRDGTARRAALRSRLSHSGERRLQPELFSAPRHRSLLVPGRCGGQPRQCLPAAGGAGRLWAVAIPMAKRSACRRRLPFAAGAGSRHHVQGEVPWPLRYPETCRRWDRSGQRWRTCRCTRIRQTRAGRLLIRRLVAGCVCWARFISIPVTAGGRFIPSSGCSGSL